METNEHTGARLVSKPSSKEYREGWDRIFAKKPPETEVKAEIKRPRFNVAEYIGENW